MSASAEASPEALAFATWPRPAVAVDLVIFTVLDADLKVLLIRRGAPPFAGRPALPGGFVRVGAAGLGGEDLEAAAHRELAEETGLPAGSCFLEQLGAFGRADRDPRGRVIAIAWYALVRPELAPLVQAGSDAADAGWRSMSGLDPDALAFDHGEILAAALATLRRDLERSPLAFALAPATFSIAELRAVFDVIHGQHHDPGNFRRRFQRMIEDGLVEPAPGRRVTGRRRARVYRFVGSP